MAKRRKKRIAPRGSVNTIILKTLINGDKYGYEIIKEVEEFSDGKIKLKQPSLYSSLSRFEEKGIVTSYWDDSDIGGRRHYYHLTDKGQKFYRVSVLKIKDDDFDEEDFVIKDSSIDENINSNINAKEIDPNEIPAIVDFNKEVDAKIELPDHDFNLAKETSQQITIEAQRTSSTSDEYNHKKTLSEKWKIFIQRTKMNNKRCLDTSCKKLHFKVNVKKHKVILDSDGIFKLRDNDYSTVKHTHPKPKIVDNVGKRIANNNFFDSIYGSQNSSTTNNSELSQEEKLRKNQNFEERFNQLTESKLKPVIAKKETEQATSPIADKEQDIDYRSKLDLLLNTKQEQKTFDPETVEENNLFNYIDSDDTKDQIHEEDKFINFDSETFEVKSDNKQYIDEIFNYTAPQESIKINRYEMRRNAIDSESNVFVLINKVRCIFGIILLLVCALELTVSLVLFKNSELMQGSDINLFIYGFVLIAVISLFFILPIIFNPHEHKMNTFKFKYAEILGILTFLVSLVLIYSINALLGFEIDNFNYFAVELIVPTLLSFNFVILPPIYYLLIRSNRFYD